MSRRTGNSILNICTGLIGQLLSLFVQFGVRTVFIYVLGSLYLGISGLFGNILSLLSFAELGFGQAIIFALYKPIAQNDEERIGALMALFRKVYYVMFVIISVLGFSLTPFLESFINKPVDIPHLEQIYILYVISTASTYLFSYKKSLLFAAQKSYVVTIRSYWFTICGAVLQVLVLLIWSNFILYLIVQILMNLVQDIVVARKTDKIYPFVKKRINAKLPKEELSKIKKNVRALIIYKIGTLSLNSTDNIIISKFVGLLQVGFYSNYLLICTSVGGFLSTIFSNITASIGNLNATASKEECLTMFYRINMATFWLYGISSVCLYTCMTPFILLWVGREYAISNSTCFIIAFNQYIAGMLFSSYNYRQTMGLFVQGQLRPIISAILNIVLSIVLAIYFGLPGVLWGTAVTRLTTNVWYDPYIVFKRGFNCGLWPYLKIYCGMMITFVFTCVVCERITSYIEMDVFLNLILTFLSTLVISFLIFALVYGRSIHTKYLYFILRNARTILKGANC